MKKLILIIISLTSIQALGSDQFYKRFQDHPDFRRGISRQLQGYSKVGSPRITETRTFGEGYDLWKDFLYVQKVTKDERTQKLTFKVKTHGILIDCGDNESYPRLTKKYCSAWTNFVSVYSDVSLQKF